jgi:ubiquinone/menaquinone biosynthesis C-methylase UbiE
MEHRDHVALIRDGVDGAGPRWLELGAGEGAFTLALADLLGPGAEIVAVDRDDAALARLGPSLGQLFPGARVETRAADFTRLGPPPAASFDGVLAANSLHYVRELDPVLAWLREALRPSGRLLVVEYDADRGNPWVPYPFSFRTWQGRAVRSGFAEPRLVGRVPSRFLGAMYAAVAELEPHPDEGGRGGSKVAN